MSSVAHPRCISFNHLHFHWGFQDGRRQTIFRWLQQLLNAFRYCLAAFAGPMFIEGDIVHEVVEAFSGLTVNVLYINFCERPILAARRQA